MTAYQARYIDGDSRVTQYVKLKKDRIPGQGELNHQVKKWSNYSAHALLAECMLTYCQQHSVFSE